MSKDGAANLGALGFGLILAGVLARYGHGIHRGPFSVAAVIIGLGMFFIGFILFRKGSR